MGEALLGVRASSDLAEASGNAVSEYSVAVADSGEGDELSEAARRLLRLRNDVPGALSLSLAPRYRLERSSTATADPELTTGRLAISASLPVVRALDVELEYRERREFGADASDFGAVFKVRRPLALAERLSQGLMLDASVSWPESDAEGRALWQNGVGGQIALEYQRSMRR